MDGLLVGIILALFSLVLAVVWDIVKRGQETKRQDETVLAAIRSEIINNVTIIDRNINLILLELPGIQVDLPGLVRDMSVVEPLTLLRNGGWEMLRVTIPKQLTERPDTLTILNDFFVLVEQLNEVMRSREAFRVNNLALDTISLRLKAYDESVIRHTILLIQSMMKLNPILKLDIRPDKALDKLLALKIPQ